MPDDGVWRNAIRPTEIAYSVPSIFAVVSKDGDDTDGNGAFDSPFLTITAGLAAMTKARNTLIVMPGEYDEAALVWPNVTGINLVALGPVTITNTDAAAAVITIAPTFTASTFEASISGPLNLSASAQIGLKVANAAMTKKLNVHLDGFSAEMDTSGDSIDIAGTVSGQAIRVYAKNLDLEGLLHFTANDAGSRLRIRNGDLVGGLTCAGSVAAEVTLRNVQVKTSALTVASEWTLCNVGCVYATDADPSVHSEFADAFAG